MRQRSTDWKEHNQQPIVVNLAKTGLRMRREGRPTLERPEATVPAVRTWLMAVGEQALGTPRR